MGRRRKEDDYLEGIALIYTFLFMMKVAGKGIEDLVDHVAKKDPQKAQRIVEEFCKGVRKK